MPDHFERLLDAVYESATDPTAWPRFVDLLTSVFGGNVVGFVSQDLGQKRDVVSLMNGLDAAESREYEEHWAARNVWIAGAADRIVSGIVMTGQMMCDDRVLARSAIWNDFFRRYDAFHLIGGCIERTGTRTSNFTIIRPQRLGPYDTEDLDLLTRLMPHLQRAVRIHNTLSGVNRGRNPIVEVADSLQDAFFLVDCNARVFFANRAAEEILQRNDGLTLAGGVLAGLSTAVTANLRRMAAAGGGVLRIPRRGEQREFMAFAVPILSHLAAVWIDGPRPTAALFVRDPDQTPETSAEQLAAVYGVTRAESRVASLLLKGLSVTEVADSLKISMNTARTHVRQLLSKTGTRRQSELLLVLLREGTPVRPRASRRSG